MWVSYPQLITASVQLVGVYLVFASLLVPALATAGMRERGRLAVAYAIGAAVYISGRVLSAVLDLPSGALIVWTLAGCTLLASLSPRCGARTRRTWRRKRCSTSAPEFAFTSGRQIPSVTI